MPLDATVVGAAFMALRTAFGSASPALLSLTLNAYTIVVAALLVPSGRVADPWDRNIFDRRSTDCAWPPTNVLLAFRVTAMRPTSDSAS